MTPHPRDASALDALLGDCRRLLGDRLLAAALYGEAATEAYRPGRSRLETVLLVDRVLPADVPLLHRAHVAASAQGFFVEMRELWTEGGELVALNQQTFVWIR